MPEVIEISYAANGQVGARPRRIRRNESFRFICSDPGVLQIEFLTASPLQNGQTRVGKDQDFVAANLGSFRFRCRLTDAAGNVRVLDPSAAGAGPIGGELEVTPGG